MRAWIVLCLAVVVASVALGQFVDPAQRVDEAREKAAAARAARVDAMRQLGEAIQGVRIDSKTVVKDFVTESDEINADFMAFLQGAQQEGEPVFQDDGTVEVTMIIYRDQVVSGLQGIHENNGSQTISSPQQFQNMRQYYKENAFRATGTGAMTREPLPPCAVDVWSYIKPQGKLMARRAAQADAYRNMGETLMGVRINSHTEVRDFVAVSDQINAAFQGVVRGVEFVGERYRPEGIVEVTAQVDIDKFIRQLSGICQQNYKGDEFDSQIFQGIRRYCPGTVIQCTGVGAPPPQFITKRPSYPSPVQPEQPTQPVIEKPFVPEWADRTIKVTGTGAYREDLYGGQAKAMAKRAAQMDAYRLLVEQVMGLYLKSETTVRDFVTTSDELVGKVNGYLRGAKEVDFRDIGDGTVEVDMELYLGDMWQIIEQDYRSQIENSRNH